LTPGCREETEFPNDNSQDNPILLVNTSFELGIDPSLTGWRTNAPALVDFSRDVPPDGGLWSAVLGTNPGTDVFLLTTVPVQEGSDAYRLTLWTRRIGVGGMADLILIRNDSMIVTSSALVPDISWSEVSLLDTLTTIPGDSLAVRLSGGVSAAGDGTTLFDLCTLERL
jgi:hypothetical protein